MPIGQTPGLLLSDMRGDALYTANFNKDFLFAIMMVLIMVLHFSSYKHTYIHQFKFILANFEYYLLIVIERSLNQL